MNIFESYLSKVIIVFFLWMVLAFCGACPIHSLVSSGGGYEMEFSHLASGGQLSSGGDYISKGALSQVHLPAGDGSFAGGYANRVGFYNPPHFTYQRGLPIQLSFESGNVELFLPANSVGKNVFDITINKDVVDNPLIADSSKIDDANLKMEANEGAWSRLYSGNISEMVIFDEQNYWDEPFSVKGTLAMSYEDANDDGILDNSNPPVRIDTLQVWGLDKEWSRWDKMADASIDTNLKKILLPFSSPGVYALLGQISDNVKNVRVYPVPFRPNGPNAGKGIGKTGTEVDGINFYDVPNVGNIEIYTIDGRLVKKIDIASNLVLSLLGGVPEVNWNVKNKSGQKVASGVYIWRVVSEGNSKTGKLMVIR